MCGVEYSDNVTLYLTLLAYSFGQLNYLKGLLLAIKKFMALYNESGNIEDFKIIYAFFFMDCIFLSFMPLA